MQCPNFENNEKKAESGATTKDLKRLTARKQQLLVQVPVQVQSLPLIKELPVLQVQVASGTICHDVSKVQVEPVQVKEVRKLPTVPVQVAFSTHVYCKPCREDEYQSESRNPCSNKTEGACEESISDEMDYGLYSTEQSQAWPQLDLEYSSMEESQEDIRLK